MSQELWSAVKIQDLVSAFKVLTVQMDKQAKFN